MTAPPASGVVGKQTFFTSRIFKLCHEKVPEAEILRKPLIGREKPLVSLSYLPQWRYSLQEVTSGFPAGKSNQTVAQAPLVSGHHRAPEIVHGRQNPLEGLGRV